MSDGVFPWRDAILALVVLERLAELWYARDNARALLARGGIEVGAGHYPLLVALHAAWLAALILLVPRHAPVNLALLALFAALMAGRGWILVALGPYWTTRIVTIPGEPLVRRGPYRFLRHPNYLVVAGEIAVLPLVFGAWEIALLFTALNLPLLAWRMRIEDRALAERRALPARARPGPNQGLGA